MNETGTENENEGNNQDENGEGEHMTREEGSYLKALDAENDVSNGSASVNLSSYIASVSSSKRKKSQPMRIMAQMANKGAGSEAREEEVAGLESYEQENGERKEDGRGGLDESRGEMEESASKKMKTSHESSLPSSASLSPSSTMSNRSVSPVSLKNGKEDQVVGDTFSGVVDSEAALFLLICFFVYFRLVKRLCE